MSTFCPCGTANKGNGMFGDTKKLILANSSICTHMRAVYCSRQSNAFVGVGVEIYEMARCKQQ